MDNKNNDKCFVNRVEVGSSSAGAVNKIMFETCGKKENANGVQPSDNPEKDKNVSEPNKVKGCDIYKEFEGVKALGTITKYIPSANLFEVLYQNDNRMEYLTFDEIIKNLANKEDICRFQQVSSPPPSTDKAIENKMKKVAAAEETPTSKRRRGNFSGGAYSNRVVNDNGQIEVTPPEESKKKEKAKSAPTYTKTEVKTEGKPWYSKKLNATKTEPYEPYQFVGLYICKERNGVRCLGTIEDYSPEKNNMLKVKYKVDGMIEYLTQIEALYAMAKSEDFLTVQRTPNTRNGSKKQIGKKKADVEEGSTRAKKK